MSSTLELWTYSLLSTFLVSIIPVLLLLLVPFLQSRQKGKNLNISSGYLNWFLCFAAGALLGDAFLHLIGGHEGHSDHHHNHEEHEHGAYRGISILAGICLFFGIELFSSASACHQGHHKKSDDDDNNHSHGNNHNHGGINGFLSLIADSIHNFTDGLTIAAAWASSPSAGISTTVAIFLHEIPHELGDYAVLSKAGYNHKQILKCQLITGAIAFIGTLLGLFLQSSKNAQTLFKSILPFAAGGFIYLALSSIIPEILRSQEGNCRKQKVMQFGIFLMGILLMNILD